VPTIVLYEVFKILLLRASKTDADLFISQALGRTVVDLSDTIALAAASYSTGSSLMLSFLDSRCAASAHSWSRSRRNASRSNALTLTGQNRRLPVQSRRYSSLFVVPAIYMLIAKEHRAVETGAAEAPAPEPVTT